MHFDWLTGLPDRASLMDALRRERKAGAGGSLAFVDIDRFKQLNHEYGHRFGDEILRIVARRLQTNLPFNVHLSRIGGDEFVVLVPGVPVPEAQRLMGRLLERLREPIVEDGHRVVVTASIGLAPLAGGSTDEVDGVLRAADTALWTAKERGRDRVVAMGDELLPNVVKRRELAATVVELQSRIRELQAEARTDALTGLFNRRALDEVMDVRCNASSPAGMAVVFVDIDHFGEYNKLHTDAGGDEALRAVAQAVRACAREGDDMVFRKGGEELTAVLFGADSADAAWATAERVRCAVEALAIAHAGSSTAPVVTVTVGVAWGRADQTVRQLLEQAADLVMAAKRNGQRNRVHGRPDR